MKLSVTQAAIVISTVAALTIVTAIGNLDGGTFAVILAGLAGNALGYVNGKAVAHKEATTAAVAAVAASDIARAEHT